MVHYLPYDIVALLLREVELHEMPGARIRGGWPGHRGNHLPDSALRDCVEVSIKSDLVQRGDHVRFTRSSRLQGGNTIVRDDRCSMSDLHDI